MFLKYFLKFDTKRGIVDEPYPVHLNDNSHAGRIIFMGSTSRNC